PLESQQWVLAAIARLGFQISTVTFESSKLRGVAQQLPFHQEMHLNPPSSYQGRIGKVGLSFVASPRTMAFVLRAEDRETPSDESFGVFQVPHAEAGDTDWNAKITEWLEKAVALPHSSRSGGHGGPPPPGGTPPGGQAPLPPPGGASAFPPPPPPPPGGSHRQQPAAAPHRDHGRPGRSPSPPPPPPPGGASALPPPPPPPPGGSHGQQPAAASHGDYGRPGGSPFPQPAPAPGQMPGHGQMPGPSQMPGHGHAPGPMQTPPPPGYPQS